jgi:hypothetical protein
MRVWRSKSGGYLYPLAAMFGMFGMSLIREYLFIWIGVYRGSCESLVYLLSWHFSGWGGPNQGVIAIGSESKRTSSDSHTSQEHKRDHKPWVVKIFYHNVYL